MSRVCVTLGVYILLPGTETVKGCVGVVNDLQLFLNEKTSMIRRVL